MTTNEMIEFLKSKSDQDAVLISMDYNPHNPNLYTIEKYLEDFKNSVEDDFIDDNDKEKCLSENKMWCIQWHPHGHGFFGINASELDLGLKYLCDLSKRNI